MSAAVSSPTPTTGSSTRGSYPSRQKRFGPAPLASFEDLPTDEQSSSEDEKLRTNGSPLGDNDDIIDDDNLAHRMPQISFLITDYNETEHCAEPQLKPWSAANIASPIIAISEEASTRKCANDLSLSPTFVTDSKRKGSWTDIFSLRKSPTPSTSSAKTGERKFSLFNFKFFSKDSRTNSECELRNDGRISEQKVSNYAANNNPQATCIDIGTSLECLSPTPISSTDSDAVMSTKSSKSFTSMTETVVKIEQPYSNTGTPTKDDTIASSYDGSSCSSLENHEQVEHCCCETETDCAGCTECDDHDVRETSPSGCDSSQCESGNDESKCQSNGDEDDDRADETDFCNAADAEDNDEGNEERLLASEDCELECLLTGDELEQNINVRDLETSSTTSTGTTKTDLKQQNPSYFGNRPSFIVSGDVTLKASPIERPHSITANNNCCNINLFEAYINQFTPDHYVNNCDRLTVTIPGLQNPNSPRNRITRKSNPYIWQEFCEQGLKSPQISRKRANSCFPEILQSDPKTVVVIDSNDYSPDANLTPITPIKDMDDAADRFDDNFWDYLNNRAKSVDSSGADEFAIRQALNDLRKMQTTTSCSCDCNSSILSTTNELSSKVTVTKLETKTSTAAVTCSDLSSYSESENYNDTTTDSAPNSHTEPRSSSFNANEFNEDQPLVSSCDCACHQIHSTIETSTERIHTTSAERFRASLIEAAIYDEGKTEDDCDFSQLSSSTLSSSSSVSSSLSQTTASSAPTSHSVRVVTNAFPHK